MSETKSSYDSLMEWLYAIRDARKEAGETVDTVEWLTEIYEGRGYSHDDAVKLARGETLPEEPRP